MIKTILIATSVAAIAAVGGSLIHPFGPPGIRGLIVERLYWRWLCSDVRRLPSREPYTRRF